MATAVWEARAAGLKRKPVLVGAGLLIALLGALFGPAGGFTIDEALYADMAHAMASRGALDITPQNLADGAPLIEKSDGLVRVIDERILPQYPSLYAIIAAPFYAALGVKGLFLLNSLCAIFALLATYEIARGFSLSARTAGAAVILLGAASIFPGYVFAIWPHMLALAFLLGGAWGAQRAGLAGPGKAIAPAALAGLCFGLGVGVRVDVVLSAIAAFFWLRLFAKPSDRIAALALIAGLAPGFLLAACLNEAKFGAFTPFTYGHAGGGTDLGRYALIGAGVGLISLAALVVDVSAKPFARFRDQVLERRWTAFGALAVLALGGLLIAAPNLLHGLYVLIVDLQAFAGGGRDGQVRDAFGYWTFWGLPKKALLQSMPFLPLALLPFAAFLKGQNVRMASFLILLSAAPIIFFALNAWDGGMAFNLRYYLPAAPFLVILAACGLEELAPQYKTRANLFLRGAIVGFMFAVATYSMAPAFGPRFERAMELYPQLVVSAALAIALMITILRAEAHVARLAAAALAAAALGVSVLISLSDVAGYTGLRARNAALQNAYACALPADAAVFSAAEQMLVEPALNGVVVMGANLERTEEAHALIAAYHAGGRCVFAHTSLAAPVLGGDKAVRLEIPETAPYGDLELYAHADNPSRCRTGAR